MFLSQSNRQVLGNAIIRVAPCLLSLCHYEVILERCKRDLNERVEREVVENGK